MLLFTFVFILTHLFYSDTLWAGTGSVVSIAVDDEEQVVTTDAGTVGEVLARAGVEVGSDDLVEPALDTEILSGSFHINIYRARPVQIIDGDTTHQVDSPYRSPKLVAERSAGLSVHPEDTYDVELIRDFVEDQTIGQRITVNRAVPARIQVDGTTLQVRTQAETVGQLLGEQGIKLDGDDRLNVSKTRPVKPGMSIQVTRVGHKVIAVEKTIDRPVRVVYDDSQPQGHEKVRQPGADGQQLVTYKVRYHNNREVDRTVVQTVTKQKPKERVVVRGSRQVNNYDDPFAALRQCESGGDYQALSHATDENGTPLFYGAYQFSLSTWPGYVPDKYKNVLPSEAPPAIQDQAARALHDARGWQPWPACRRSLGLP